MFTLPIILGAGLLCRSAIAAPLSPEDAVSHALSIHPQLRTSEANLQVALAAHTRAAAPRYNPTLSAQAALSGDRLGLSLAQPLSLTGVRRAQRLQTRAALDAATADLERTRRVVAAEARSAYVEATVTAAVARLARDSVQLSEQLESAARLRYAEGEASLLDLRLTRLSLARSASWLLDASARESIALQGLSAMLGQPVAIEDLTAALAQVAPLPGGTSPANRSDVVAAEARTQAAELDLRQQRAAAIAPVSVGMFIQREDASTFVGPSVGWELPLFARNQLAQAEAQADVWTAQAAQTSTTTRAISEIATSTARHAEAEALVAGLGADLSMEADEALDGIAFSYQAGHTDLLSTLILQSEVLSGQAALIALEGQLADARLALLLAQDDDALLGGVR